MPWKATAELQHYFVLTEDLGQRQAAPAPGTGPDGAGPVAQAVAGRPCLVRKRGSNTAGIVSGGILEIRACQLQVIAKQSLTD